MRSRNSVNGNMMIIEDSGKGRLKVEGDDEGKMSVVEVGIIKT